MILNFILSHLNLIILITWIIFLIIVGIRYFKPSWVKNISYRKLFFGTIGIHVFYGLFISWGQYYVWANGSEMTKMLVNLPISAETPFPKILWWARSLFENNLGYFLYYIWGRFWLNIFISFLTSGLIFLIFKTWKHYRGGFQEGGPLFLLILMLISGFPGILVNVSLGFIFAVILFFVNYLKKRTVLNIEPVFIFSTLISLLFTNIILLYVL
jgi:hypothetical protein